MEEWSTPGAQSPADIGREREAVALLTRASASIQESATQLSRLQTRLAELLTGGGSFPHAGASSERRDLWAEIWSLRADAEAMLESAASGVVEAGDVLSTATTIAGSKMGVVPEAPEGRPVRPAPSPDEVTERADAGYRRR